LIFIKNAYAAINQLISKVYMCTLHDTCNYIYYTHTRARARAHTHTHTHTHIYIMKELLNN